MNIFSQVDSVIKEISDRQKQKTEEHIQNLLKSQGQKDLLQISRQINNPEEVSKSGNNNCLTTEDTSYGSGVQKKALEMGMKAQENCDGNTQVSQISQSNKNSKKERLKVGQTQQQIVTIDLDENQEFASHNSK